MDVESGDVGRSEVAAARTSSAGSGCVAGRGVIQPVARDDTSTVVNTVNDLAHDEEPVRARLETHHAEGWSWALACCRGDATQAEDVLHVAYQKVLDGRARFEGRSSFKTWLFGVIRLTALDQRRKDWRRWLRFGPLAEAEDRFDTRAAAPERLALDERCVQLRVALDGLAARQAEVLRLVFYHDLTLDEAAAAMGVSAGTARTHYERGKERLRRRLTAS